ncbi:MAG: hypothetical protein IJM81_09885 [Prevotella sp.]|nr:hypothetical protein [Prevotella sp.]
MKHANLFIKSGACRLWLVLTGVMLLLPASAQTGNKQLFTQWVEDLDDGGQMLYDLSDGQHFIQAYAYTETYCEEMHGAYTPGVFYQIRCEDVFVVSEGKDSGTIKYRNRKGEEFEVCQYSNLTKNNVTLLFEGEFEHEAKKAARTVEVVNPNSEELNVEDMITMWNYWDDTSDAMSILCEDKNLYQLEHKDGDDNGYSCETWGRNIKANGWQFTKTGDDALAIFCLTHKNDEFKEVCIIFSDPRLVPIYEKQLAQHGYFKQRTRNVEGMEETIYAPDSWEEESDEPTYTITNDGQGLYHLSFMDMI